MTTREQKLAENFASVHETIKEACVLAGRTVSDVRLIAVSKAKPLNDIFSLARIGQKDFGENYMQEALEKIDQAKAANAQLQWHFIGTLQSNKAKFVPGNFSLFHGLHSSSVAEKINRKAAELGIVQQCLVEVNIDEESSKSGILPTQADEFIERLAKLPNLSVIGFMCIPDPQKGESRSAYAKMREISEAVNARGAYPKLLNELSMGMSHDCKEAILEGATMVRVGTKIFGARGKG